MTKAEAKARLRRHGVVLVLAALAVAVTVLALRQLVTARLLAGHRPEYHAVRVLLVADLWHDGELIPRWVPALAGGLGYPLFIYYAWLSYALAAELHVLGAGPVAAMNAVTIGAAIAMAVGAWRLGRELGGRAGGWLAWALFAFAPYQLVNLYVRGNFPEVVASAFAPWALWALVRVALGRERWSLPVASASLAAIVLSHNISGLTLGTTIVACGLLFAATLPRESRRTALGRVALAGTIGVLLCGLFWLPILAGRGDVGLANDFNAYLDFRQHFLEPRQLVATGWGYGFSVPGPGDTMPLQLGIPQVAALIVLGPTALVLAARSAGRRRVRLLGFALAGLGLAFLTTTWSAPVWSLLKPLALLQFPWRLHLPGTLVAAATGALAVRVLVAAGRPRPPRRRLASLVAPLLAIGLAASTLPHCRPLTSYDCDESCVRRQLRLGYYTTCIQDEFRPIGATDLAALGRLMLGQQVTLDGVAVSTSPLPRPEQRGAFTLEVAAERSGTLALPVFWFPGWRLAVDGRPAAGFPCPGTGALCVSAPAGRHSVSAAWRPTLAYHAGLALSLVAAAALLVLALRRTRRRSTTPIPLPSAG